MKSIIAVLTIAAILMTASLAMAENMVVIEGEFKGALYAYLSKDHPERLSKAQIDLEPDFVLCDDNGKEYFIANLSRSKKVRYINEQVRISGEIGEEGMLYAECMEVYRNGKFVKVWDIEQDLQEKRSVYRGK